MYKVLGYRAEGQCHILDINAGQSGCDAMTCFKVFQCLTSSRSAYTLIFCMSVSPMAVVNKLTCSRK